MAEPNFKLNSLGIFFLSKISTTNTSIHFKAMGSGSRLHVARQISLQERQIELREYS